MNDVAARYSVVLVAPQGALNVGSVARAMANFGFSDLRLVTPEIDHLGNEARRMAVKAASILESASVYPDLPAALADCHLALGTTRRFGKYRENFLYPDDISEFATPFTAHGRIALVFGREDSGLLTEELDLCQRFITIPTCDTLPSMNLAQAVSLCLYETSKVTTERSVQEGGRPLASGEMLEAMYQHLRKSLLAIDYLHPQNPDHILHAFRRIFGRAQLDDREVRIIRGMCRKIDWVDSDRRSRIIEDER
jgi:tRNA/rRNA methyltransferase